MLHEVLDQASAAHRGATALLYGDETWTFEQLARRVRSLATGLERLVGPGDRIAILAENCPAYVECLYGAPAAGALLVLLNHRLHPDEWEAQLRATEASVLVGERSLLEQFGDRRARLDSLRRVVAIDDPGRDELGYEDILAEPAAHSRVRSENDGAWLIFTSGTTGTPKGALLTHASLSAALDVTQQCRPVRNDDVYLFPFPLCHVSAYNVMLFHREARPIVLARRFTTTGVAELVQRHSVTTVSLAPTMLAMLLEDPSIDEYDLSSLRTIGYGASAIPESVLRAAAARFGCEFSQGYGMTELSGNAVFLDADAHRRALAGDDALLKAAGRPRPPVDVSIVDDELREVAPGAAGEILVRADQTMRGYWRDPEATGVAIVGGWLRTGDVGRLDDEGFLFVVDRKKDVIVSGGENVSSQEVERVVREHPGVRDVAVIGLPDERWGEIVCAVVVRDEGAAVDPRALIAFVGTKLAGFKKPKRVTFVDALPVNAAGKVLKAQLRAACS